jgi:hypothetical protein
MVPQQCHSLRGDHVLQLAVNVTNVKFVALGLMKQTDSHAKTADFMAPLVQLGPKIRGI